GPSGRQSCRAAEDHAVLQESAREVFDAGRTAVLHNHARDDVAVGLARRAMHRDEKRVAKRWRKLRSCVEPQIDWRDVRREIECPRYGVGDGDVALRGAQLGLADVRLILRDEEREAVVLAGFDEIDLVGRKIVAEIVLSGLAGPHASGVRIPVEAAGVVQTARVRLQRAVARQNLNRRAARVGFNADVARRAYRYVEPAV